MDTFDKYFMEIQMLMRRYQMTAARCETPEDLLALRREENDALLELVQQQKRALSYTAGENVEPMTHFAKVVVTGTGGQ